MEEYVAERETPEYRKYDTNEVLEYQRMDEIMEKYLSGANKIESDTKRDNLFCVISLRNLDKKGKNKR